MERPDFDWDDTDTFATGTVGPVGRRVFFIQARRADDVVSLKMEKQLTNYHMYNQRCGNI